MPTPNHYVLTGGPCAGKTTLVFELEKRGYQVLPEAARLIIDEQLANGRSIQEIVTDPEWLISVVRRKFSMEKEVPADQLCFFDRGVPDSIAYYGVNGKPIDDEFRDALVGSRYKKVFLLDLIDFVNDEARSETPEQARALHEAIKNAYESLGYDLVKVPVLPVGERADFVLANV